LCQNFNAIDETLKRHLDLPVDVLINNAGGSVDGRFEALDPGDFERQMQLNYLSAVYVTRSLIGDMKLRARLLDRGVGLGSETNLSR